MIKVFRYAIATISLVLSTLAPHFNTYAGQSWTVEIDESTGLPLVGLAGQDATKSTWAFWGAQWKWASAHTQMTATQQGYQFTGKVNNLALHWSGNVVRPDDRTLTYDFRIAADKTQHDAIGGGVIFKFDLKTFAESMGKPVLLPGNTGWEWGRADGPRFTMRFSPALPGIFFERGNPAEVRAYFFNKNIAAGEQHYTVTLQWSGNAKWRPTVNERLGGGPLTTWPKDVIDASNAPQNLLGNMNRDISLANLSDHSNTARYWGTNITASALFTTPRDVVQQQAKRMAALGYNLVRIHHHDSAWVNPNIFGDRKTVTDTQTLSADSLDKLDWWIKSLKDEGISVWLDLHVGRPVFQDDGIYGFNELAKGKDKAEVKGFNYVNITIQQAMRRFNEQYVTHRNRYTNIAYKDEPAIIGILITNENDITHHFGNAMLNDKGVPLHNKLYMNAANSFSQQQKLPEQKTWRSWEPGPSKIFLNDLEHRFDVDIINHLHNLGVKQPLATTNTWGNNPLFSLPALTTGDIIDAHAYGTPGQLEKSPIWSDHLGHWIAAAQVVGMPLTATEWNAGSFPAYDRHTLPLMIAAMASHQGWRALMHYAYSQEAPRNQGTPSNWHSYNDPSLLPMLSAAGLMYRRGDVREATTTYVYDPGAEAFFGKDTSAGNSPALRTAAEQGKLLIAMPQTPELPWLKRRNPPADAIIIKDPTRSLLPEGADEATSDTSELTHNWTKGTYTINTARTQAAMGWIGGSQITLPALQLDLKTRNAAVALQSLNDDALGSSKDLMLSIGTRSQPQPNSRKTPFIVEPLAGRMEVKAPAGLTLYRNGPFNQWLEYPAQYKNGRYLIELDGTLPIQWMALRQSKPA